MAHAKVQTAVRHVAVTIPVAVPVTTVLRHNVPDVHRMAHAVIHIHAHVIRGTMSPAVAHHVRVRRTHTRLTII